MRSVWSSIMLTGERPSAACGWLTRTAAKALLPNIEREARALTALANLNRTVHLPTYNTLFLEESRRFRHDRDPHPHDEEDAAALE